MILLKFLQNNLVKVIISSFLLFLFLYFWKVLLYPNNYIFGYLGDQVFLFFYKWWVDNYSALGGSPNFTDYLGYPYGYNLILNFKNQLVLWQAFFISAKLFGALATYNYFVVLSFLLNFVFFYVSYVYFMHGKFERISTTGYFLAFLFSLNSHVFLQAKNHLDLLQIWIIPLGFVCFGHCVKKGLARGIFVGVLFSFFIAISNYYAYILFLLVGFYTLTLLFQKKINLTFLLGFGLSVIIGGYLTLSPFISAMYLNNTPQGSQVSQLKRDVFDFVNFSSRPWYYFLPSVQNPFFGEFSKFALAKLSSTDNYLTKHYFSEEHGGNYLGVVVTLLFIYSIKQFYKKNEVRVLLLLIGCFFILSLPPVVTWNLHDIYLPSYVLYKMFPMFRVLSRFSIVIYTLMLFVSGYGISHLLEKRKSSALVLMPVLLSVHLFEMYIPPKMVDISNPPEVYSYIGEKVPYQSVAIYPYNKTGEAIFWANVHKSKLMNPRDYKNEEVRYSSEEFTESLLTPEGLNKFIQSGGHSLVVFKDDIVTKDIEILRADNRFIQIKEYDESYLFSINN